MLVKFLKKWHKKYIYSFDPYHLRFKTAIKSVLSMSVTALIFYDHTNYLIWAIVATFITGMVQSGSNIKKRRKNMLFTILLITILAPLLSLVSNNIVITVCATTILTFILIYIGALGKGVGQVGMISLIYIVVFTNFKISIDNIQYVFLSVFTGGIIAFFFHYILLPVRPIKVYKAGINAVLTDMKDFCQTFHNISDGKQDQVVQIDRQYQKTFMSLEKFKTLPGFLGYTPEKEDGPNTSMIYLTNLLGQILEEFQNVFKITSMFTTAKLPNETREKIIDNVNLCLSEFERWIKAVKNNKVIKSWQVNLEIIESIQKEILDDRVNKRMELSKDMWGELFQIIFQLKQLATDLPRLSDFRKKVDILIDNKRTGSFKDSLGILRSHFSFASPYFRYTLQLTITVGIAMFLNLFFKLDHGVWLVFLTITMMKPTIGNSTKVGFQRVVATLIGVVIATGFAYLINMNHTVLFVILILSIIVYLYLQQSPYYFVAVIFLTIGMMSVYYIFVPDAWKLSIVRAYDTAAAFGLGFIISFVFWPNKASKRLINEIKEGMEAECQYMKSIWSMLSSDSQSSKEVRVYKVETNKIIEGYKESYHFAMLEPGGKRVQDIDLTTIIESQKKLLRIFDNIEHYFRIDKKNIMKNNIGKLYDSILNEIVKTLEAINKLMLTQVDEINLDSLNERYTSFIKEFNHEVELRKNNNMSTDSFITLYSINWYIGNIKDDLKTLSDSTVNFFSKK